MKKSIMRRQAALVLIGLGLSGAVGSARHDDAQPQVDRFVFQPIAFLDDPAPGGGTFLDVFESNFINNRGDVLFGSNVTANEEQGLFLLRTPAGLMTEIARVGEPAPGGNEFGAGFLSPTSLNDRGDAGFVFLLNPFSFPVGVNAGVYRLSYVGNALTPIVTPEVTLAPEGEAFAGATFGTSLNNEGVLVFGGIVPTESGSRRSSGSSARSEM